MEKEDRYQTWILTLQVWNTTQCIYVPLQRKTLANTKCLGDYFMKSYIIYGLECFNLIQERSVTIILTFRRKSV